LTPEARQKSTEKLRQNPEARSERGLEKLITAARHWIF
jgi:hypothetical protein